jgi:uncharacterized protein
LDKSLLFALLPIAFAGATVNGILGHGFSTLSVPLALIWLTNRLLNPVLVLLEVVLNAGAFFNARREYPSVAHRVRPFALGLLPGIALGTLLLQFIEPGSMKALTYLLLLPLVLGQIFSRGLQLKESRALGLGAGFLTGTIYSATTISGPLLSVYFHRLKLPRRQYRAAISFLRLTESLITAAGYVALGLFTSGSLRLFLLLLPISLLGLAFGSWLAQRFNDLGFRRFCVVFNAFAVSYGLVRLLVAKGIGSGPWIHGVWIAVTLIAVVTQSGFLNALNPAPVAEGDQP